MAPSSMDHVAFLAGSATRVTVLELVESGPRDRDELRDATDVSRVTLSRVLSELEDRNWIGRSNGRYVATPLGEFIATEFSQLLANVDAASTLDEELGWLPTDTFGFDLDCLRDAEIVTPSHSDHTAAIRRVAGAVLESDWVRGTATGVSREVIEAIHDLTIDRGGSLDMVLAPAAVDVVRADAGLRPQFRELLGSGRADVARYEGDKPVLMGLVTDNEVLLCGHDESGPPPGTVSTTDETVRSWARAYFDDRRADAEPLDAETFTP